MLQYFQIHAKIDKILYVNVYNQKMFLIDEQNIEDYLEIKKYI